MSYPGYQCFNTDNKTVYCSLEKVNSYREGSDWVKAACANFDLTLNQIYGKPFVSMQRPHGAITWPYGANASAVSALTSSIWIGSVFASFIPASDDLALDFAIPSRH